MLTRQFSSAGMLVIGISLSSQVLADTYMSKWINQGTCQYVITRNSPDPVVLGSGATKDFGAFPYQISSENNIVVGRVEFVGQTCTGGSAFNIDFSQGYERRDCPGLDTGPYKLTVSYAARESTDHCYCIRAAQVGYIVTTITAGDAVTLEPTAGAYTCLETP